MRTGDEANGLRRGGTIVVLTGAGISKESGIDTFRDADGLWSKVNVEDVATIEAWQRDKKTVLDFSNERRAAFRSANIVPNAAHHALGRLQREWPGEVALVTQNIDLLHEAGGASRVMHMHGRGGLVRCMACGTVRESDADLFTHSRCADCGAIGELRPHIVWFGEMPLYMDEITAALERCDLFVSIGTSGTVYPAAGFIQIVRRRRPSARTIELNLEPSDGHSLFGETIYGPATEIVPAFVERLLSTAA